jgi:hypothetical protein
MSEEQRIQKKNGLIASDSFRDMLVTAMSINSCEISGRPWLLTAWLKKLLHERMSGSRSFE